LVQWKRARRMPKPPRRSGSSRDLVSEQIFELEVDEPLSIAVERELLTKAMRRTGGNRAAAARLLGMPRKVLLRRLAQLRL
jgi:DNA-binding NtrC family response regulator